MMLWPTVLGILGLMGCNSAIAREVAANPQREADWICVSSVVALGLACSCAALGYILVPYLLPSDKQFLIWLTRTCLLSVPLDIFSQMLLAAEHGRMRWRRYNLVRAVFFVCYTLLICTLWASKKAEVDWFIWMYLSSHLLAVVVRVAIQWESFVVGRLHLSECWRLIELGIPYFWSTAINLLTLQLDKILVVAFMRTEAVGIYAVAVTFSNVQYYALGEALGITSFAVLANEPSIQKQGNILSETFRQATLTALGLGTASACLIPLLIRPLFGPAFSAVVSPAVILTLATSIMAAGNVLHQGLKGAGKPYPAIVSQLVGTAILGLVAMLLSPKFGLNGMAWAVVAGACCQVLLLVVAASAILGVSTISFWPPHRKDVRALYQQLAALRAKAFAFSGPGAWQ